jgi:DNA-binding IclR family transcriptional regulator
MDKERAGIQSVEVGFGLLQVLGNASAAMPLRDVAAAAGMSAAKAHRYLVSFGRLQLVVQDPLSARYDLGPAALKLGLAALSRLDAVRLARERAGALMEQLGHTVALAVWGNHGPVIVHWEESAQAVAVNLRLGDVMPLLSSATGRCFAAHVTPKLAEPLLAKELAQAQHAPRPDLPTNEAQAMDMLAQVRKHGLGRVVNTLLPGVAGLCAPVFDADGHMVLGILSLGSAATFDAAWDGTVAKPLLLAAAQLSSDLGHTLSASASGKNGI